MKPNDWTTEPVITANTNRNGQGKLYEITEVKDSTIPVGYIECMSLGDNPATEAVILGSRARNSGTTRDFFFVATKQLPATEAGTSKKPVLYVLNKKFDVGTILYALVHTEQDAGRQFVSYNAV